MRALALALALSIQTTRCRAGNRGQWRCNLEGKDLRAPCQGERRPAGSEESYKEQLAGAQAEIRALQADYQRLYDAGSQQPPSAEAAGTVRVLNLMEYGPEQHRSNLAGFHGGFTLGRHGYLVPHNNGKPHGLLTRFSLDKFADGELEVFDLPAITGNPTLKGFSGGMVVEGPKGQEAEVVPFVVLVPYFNGQLHSNLVQLSLWDDPSLSSPDSVVVLDVAEAAGDDSLRGFLGGFGYKGHSYLVPYHNGISHSGKLVRVRASSSSVKVLDLPAITDDAFLVGFYGGFECQGFGFLVPHYMGSQAHAKLVRVDLADFSAAGVTVLDVASSLQRPEVQGFVGGFGYGDYGYLIPFSSGDYHGNLVRFRATNLTGADAGDMEEPLEVLDLVEATGQPQAVGFKGGFVAGRFGFLVPNARGYAGTLVRVDLDDFGAHSVQWLNLPELLGDNELTGFIGGFSGGSFGYLVPNRHQQGPGAKVVRISTFLKSLEPRALESEQTKSG